MKYLPILLILISGCSRFITPVSYEEGLNLTIVPHKTQLKISTGGLLDIDISNLKDDAIVVISDEYKKVWINIFCRSLPSMSGVTLDLDPIESNKKGYLAGLYKDGNRVGYLLIQNKKVLSMVIQIEGNQTVISLIADCKEENEIREPTEADLIFFKF